MTLNGNGEKLTTEQVISQIERLSGNVTAVAKACGVTRKTIYNYIHRHATVADALAQSRETMLDNVESRLYKSALDGQGWAVCFFLKTQGKSRGYVERAEFTGADGGPVESVTYTPQQWLETQEQRMAQVRDTLAAVGDE